MHQWQLGNVCCLSSFMRFPWEPVASTPEAALSVFRALVAGFYFALAYILLASAMSGLYHSVCGLSG